MRYFPSGPLMKDGDNRTIQDLGMPAMVLMERAALQSVDVLERQGVDLTHVLIVCGAGNNGGDGLAIARILQLKKVRVTVSFIGNEEKATRETRQQISILKNYGFSIHNTLIKQEYSTIIDCILGSGLGRDITGPYYSAIEALNQMNGNKIAIDIPSGISATTGKVLGIAFRADMTIALAFEKLGVVLYPGCLYAGKTVLVDIGIPADVFQNEPDIVYTNDSKDAAAALPVRRPDAHKGMHGKVLMIVGSGGMSGAAYLSARAAYETGAGLVRVYTHEDNRIILQQQLPEALVTTYTQYDEEVLQDLVLWADVIAIGAGMGKSETALQLLKGTLRLNQGPCIIDADGLNLLSEQPQLMSLLNTGNYIVTPHMKEMSRLLHCSMPEIQNHQIHFLMELIGEYNLTCVLKDARTMIASRGRKVYLNTSGNAAMAKGGTGDVLLGMIAGLAAQKTELYEAAVIGVQIHGLSGDHARRKKGSYSVLASDIIESISDVLKELEDTDGERVY